MLIESHLVGLYGIKVPAKMRRIYGGKAARVNANAFVFEIVRVEMG
jgi:hypothetical protein